MIAIAQTNKILDRFLNTSIGKQIQQEIDDETLVVRKKLLADIHRKKQKTNRELSVMRKTVSKAKLAWEAAEKKSKQFEEQYRQAYREEYSIETSSQSQINRLKKQLRDTQPDCIYKYLKLIDAEMLATQKTSDRDGATVDREWVNLVTGKAKREIYSSRQSILRRISSLGNMRNTVESWQYLAYSDAEMGLMFKKMKVELPDIKSEPV